MHPDTLAVVPEHRLIRVAARGVLSPVLTGDGVRVEFIVFAFVGQDLLLPDHVQTCLIGPRTRRDTL